MAKYIAKHIERNHQTGEEYVNTSAIYDTKLDEIYGEGRSLQWATNTANHMKGFVELVTDEGSQVVYQSKGFQRRS